MTYERRVSPPVILYHEHGAVGVGEVVRFTITCNPNLEQLKDFNSKIWLRVRNSASSIYRPAYLNGPYLLCVSVRDARFRPYHQSETSYHVSFDQKVKASSSFWSNISVPSYPVTWIIEVSSQIIFSKTARIPFDICLGKSQEDIRAHTRGTVCLKKYVFVKKEEIDDLWATAKKQIEQDIVVDSHLVVLTHGLHSNLTSDMLFLKERLEELNEKPGQKYFLVPRGFRGNICQTELGIKKLGRRMARWLLQELDFNDDTDPKTYKSKYTKISFIGHSLGGLVQIYALGYLQTFYPSILKTIEPINFITLASPLLGIQAENPPLVKLALDLGIVGRTGQDLGLFLRPSRLLEDNSQGKDSPLLKILSLPSSASHIAVKKFRYHTIYANIINDGIVPLRTSSLFFLDWKSVSALPLDSRAFKGKITLSQNDSDNDNDNESLSRPSQIHHPLLLNEDTSKVEFEHGRIENSLFRTKSPESNPDQRASVRERIITAIVTFFKTFSVLKNSPAKLGCYHRPPKWVTRAQTANNEEERGELLTRRHLPPTTSLLESARGLLNPPLPLDDFIRKPVSRQQTIFHDKVYQPSEIPTLDFDHVKNKAQPSSESNNEQVKLKLEETIARNWHTDICWRKVLVRLEPEAHNNIIVRRMFPNAYGWPVIEHLINEHFL